MRRHSSLALTALALMAIGAQAGLLQDRTRQSVNLNGEWQIHEGGGVTPASPPASGWETAKVPGQGKFFTEVCGPYAPPVKDLLNKDKSALAATTKISQWYKRSFELPALDGRRALLRFDGAAFKSVVWLNGHKVSESALGMVPQVNDITAVVKPGANELLVWCGGRQTLIDLKSQSFAAPCSGCMPGIWGDVELQLVPALHIDDVFVKTSVKNKDIDFELTAANQSGAAKTFAPAVSIKDDKGKTIAQFAGEPATLAAGETRVVNLKAPWLAPVLWTPETPVLYFAELSLTDNGALLDQVTQRFGFREFEVQGKDFLLNGARTVLLRGTCLTDLSAPKANCAQQLRGGMGNPPAPRLGRPFNSIRTHLGFSPEPLVDMADQLGLMVVVESGWQNISGKYELPASELWLPNLLEYTGKYIKKYRNHPSVVMWSLTNESFWQNTDSERMEIGRQILAAAKAADSTRPQQGDGENDWNKQLPVTNIHYPEGGGGPVGWKYPNANYVIPNDCYWPTASNGKEVGRTKFTWDRPLVLGEYFNGGAPNIVGEQFYDWELWRDHDWRGRDGWKGNWIVKTARVQTDAYRLLGAAGFTPWLGNGEDIMPEVALSPLDFHPNCFGGSTGERTMAVFNDSRKNFPDPRLFCRLSVDGKTVWTDTVHVNIPPGGKAVTTLKFPLPQVAVPTEAKLEVSLRCWQNFDFQIARHEEPIFIFPSGELAKTNPANIALFDPSGATAKALKAQGLDLKVVTSIDKDIQTLVLGQFCDFSKLRRDLAKFVKDGGRLVVLRQDEFLNIIPGSPEIDDKHAASRMWLRNHSHPVLDGVKDAQLSFWQPDNLVSERSLFKPSTGDFKALLDCGGISGMSWSPLVETPYGKGTILFSQLNLADRFDKEPMAAHLLAKILAYCQTFQPVDKRPLRLLNNGNKELVDTLKACSIVTTDAPADGPILIDGSAKIDLAELKAHLDKGGKLWLHGFTPATFAKVVPLLPPGAKLVPADKAIFTAARRSDGPLLDNLSTFDFFWTNADHGEGMEFFGNRLPTAKLGDFTLDLNGDPKTKLVEPGFLHAIPSGKGTILFDTLQWEKSLPFEAEKTARLVTSLALNLGAAVRLEPEKNYKHFPVDISKQANMHYYDKQAGDKQGGWTDQGESDLRFFLINHTGVIGAVDAQYQEFPKEVRFAKVPFHPIDPKRNDGKAVITLKGGENCAFLPGKAEGIAVNRKADRLWFLHTAAWAQPGWHIKARQILAKYVVHYDDGTSAEFPVREGVEIKDWFSPAPIPGASIGWTSPNNKGVYVAAWDNPHPAKTIKSIDFVGDLSEAVVILLGITGGVEAEAADNTLSQWDLPKLRDGAVPNQVPGAPALKLRKGTPAVAGDALRVSPGTCFESAPLGCFDGRQPFAVKAQLSVSAPPPGYYGGIFQAMGYGVCGFRLMVDQRLRVVVETWRPEGATYLTSSAPLKLDRFYDLELRFTDGNASLLLDGKLNAAAAMPLPAAYQGGVMVGEASGKDYYFDGRLQSLAVCRL